MLHSSLPQRCVVLPEGRRLTLGAFRSGLPLLAAATCLLAVAACSAETAEPEQKTTTPPVVVAAAEEMSAPTPDASKTDKITTHIVEIKNFKFVPEVITVKAGDRITWKNIDVVPHTATALDKSWNSENLGANAEWSLIVKKSDEGEYFCIYHPVMKGRVMVEE